jgi:hypothetical protein
MDAYEPKAAELPAAPAETGNGGSATTGGGGSTSLAMCLVFGLMGLARRRRAA